jgi:uncharacterized protein DUF6924
MTIPTSGKPPLVRTDFSNDVAWQAIRASILTLSPEMEDALGVMNFMNDDEDDEDSSDEPWFVDIIDERRFADLSMEDVINRLPADAANGYLFIVDRQTISDPDHPILIVDLGGRPATHVPSDPVANLHDWKQPPDREYGLGRFRGSRGRARSISWPLANSGSMRESLCRKSS